MSKFEQAGGGGAPAVDPIWDAVFGGPLGDEESTFEGGTFETLPRGTYFLKVEAAEGRLVGEDGYPTAHVGLRVVKGPAGTANRVIWDDLFLYPFPRKGETPEAAAERLRKTLTRVRNAFRLQQERPAGRSIEALSSWARQMTDRIVTAVVRIEAAREEVRDGQKTGRTFDARNRLVWDSVGNPDAVYTGDEKKYAGMTYGARAEAEIAAVDAKAAGGAGGAASGKTAGGALGSATPTGFFGGGGGAA